jgi:ADP-heptose:LPS heptosyltransferase
MNERAPTGSDGVGAAGEAGAGRGRPQLLILRALGLGDLLTIVPALRGLRDAYPEHDRTLAVPAALGPLALLTGAVDAVVAAEGLHSSLELSSCDVAVNLHGRGPESHRLLLRSSPRRLIAFANPAVPESAGGPAWVEDEHEIARWCRLLTESGIAADPAELDLLPDGAVAALRSRSAAARACGGGRPVLLHPGAKDAARRWPEDRWSRLGRRLRRRGLRVVVTAGPGEAAAARSIASAARLEPAAVISDLDVDELVGAVADAAVVVCGDTGVGHLATALRTPSVLLFGPTRPDRWGPPADRCRHRVLWTGKTGDPHADSPFEGLLEISVDDVEAAVEAAVDALGCDGIRFATEDQGLRNAASTGRAAEPFPGESS